MTDAPSSADCSQSLPTAQPLLSVSDLKIAFESRRHGRNEAVKGVSFAINPGEVVAVVGESGSGKTVTAKTILQLLPSPPAKIESGRIEFRGRDLLQSTIKQLEAIRGNDIAMIFQEPMSALNPTWRIGRQVGESLELHRRDMTAQQRQQRVIELLKAVGIPEPEQRAQQYPHELSGGMRQQVCIAMALACDPALLIADEPTTALDVTIQAQILDLLKRLQHDLQMAILFITHDLGVVADLADRVVIMWHGKIVEQGTVQEIFHNPQHPYTKGLLACRPTLAHQRDRLPTVAEFLEQQSK